MQWLKQSWAAVTGGGELPSAAEGCVWPFLSRDAAEARQTGWVDHAGFGLFLLATAVLLLRPADWVPGLEATRVYEWIMAACVSLSVPRLWRQISAGSAARPITQLTFGVCACVVISHLARGSLSDARAGGGELFKLFIYYLLVLSWVDSPARFRQFILSLCVYSSVQTAVGLLEYDGWINLSTLRSVNQAYTDPDTGTASVLRRLCGIGIFNDPNDLCLLLVTTTALCLGLAGRRRLGRLRLGLLATLVFFIYAVTLTHSRGGFLSLLGVIGTLLASRYGWRRALPAAIVLVPVIFTIFAGRQTQVDLSDPQDTFQTRLDSWSDSLSLFKQSPLLGVGEDQQMELRGSVAHNSFIQSFAELGFVGGACFLGAFAMAILAVHRTNVGNAEGELASLRPVMLAIVVGYAIGLLALSRAYTASTYLILGLTAAYVNLTPPLEPLRLDRRFAKRLAMASVLFIAATYVFVRVMSA